MKKIGIVLILTIMVILTFLAIDHFSTNKKENESITYINVSKLKEKINNKEDFVLVFTQEGCGHCESYYPVIESVAKKYNVKIYNINLTSLEKNEINEINKIASINGTPTTLFFINGEEQTTLNRINGDTTEQKLVKKLKKLGYIKE